jgi:hypothetical protein
LSVQVPMTGSDLTPWNANIDTLSAAASTPAVTAHRLTFVMLHLLNEDRIVKKAAATPVTTAQPRRRLRPPVRAENSTDTESSLDKLICR